MLINGSRKCDQIEEIKKSLGGGGVCMTSFFVYLYEMELINAWEKNFKKNGHWLECHKIVFFLFT